MQSIAKALSSLWEIPSYVVETPDKLRPVDVIFDYSPAVKIRVGWCNESGTDGRSRKALVHAIASRPIEIKGKAIAKGQPICGFSSASRYGKGDYSVRPRMPLTCAKCKQRAEGLSESILSSW
jgi:hypothetical protein